MNVRYSAALAAGDPVEQRVSDHVEINPRFRDRLRADAVEHRRPEPGHKGRSHPGTLENHSSQAVPEVPE